MWNGWYLTKWAIWSIQVIANRQMKSTKWSVDSVTLTGCSNCWDINTQALFCPLCLKRKCSANSKYKHSTKHSSKQERLSCFCSSKNSPLTLNSNTQKSWGYSSLNTANPLKRLKVDTNNNNTTNKTNNLFSTKHFLYVLAISKGIVCRQGKANNCIWPKPNWSYKKKKWSCRNCIVMWDSHWNTKKHATRLRAN